MRDQQQQSDRRQSLDPATQAAKELEPSRAASETNLVVGKRNEFLMAAKEALLFESDPLARGISNERSGDRGGWER